MHASNAAQPDRRNHWGYFPLLFDGRYPRSRVAGDSLRALAGQDGLKELRVRVRPGAEVADYRVDVKRHHPMLDSNAGAVALGGAEALRVAVEVEEEPAGLSGALRDPGAAGVERSDPADRPIGRAMGVPADDDVGRASREQSREAVCPPGTGRRESIRSRPPLDRSARRGRRFPPRRPEMILDPAVRAATSSFARMDPGRLTAAADRLARDLGNGHWDRRHGHLRDLAEFDIGLRLIVTEVA
jgi:hypothetical protein